MPAFGMALALACPGAAVLPPAAATAAEPIDAACENEPDADAQMACYVRRFCPEASTDAARAACYSQIIRALLRSPPAPALSRKPEEPSTESRTASRPSDAEAAFGLKKFPARGSSLDKLRARIAAAKPGDYGAYLIALDNGQVWEELDRTRTRFTVGEGVTIVRAMFGSYVLRPDSGGRTRVRRLSCDDPDEDAVAQKCAVVGRGVN